MTIQYLNKLKNRNTILGWKNEGLSIEEIVSLEEKFNNGNSFPRIYREYLFIAGKHCGIAIDQGLGFDWLQKTSKDILLEYKQTINRPIFIFDQLDGCEQFGFFFLDDEKDNPNIYICNPFEHIEEGEPLYYPYNQKTFSEFISFLMDSADSWDKYRNK
ncbi:SMI1/KNR4 family protein [Kordia jejudonensis]|uniref:SMI1/KNR4 family protein n=1 Tax=Kordia jejudonensis TaxID=1348245 RepID=UPI000629A164|nr:SMI1/KNR4 family protein [Kordia jejudonensis]